jgi:glycosyltransferase involved in cell wall biosynthesis
MARRAVIFATAYYPFVGGAEVAMKEITDRLPGYEFDMITARLAPRLSSRERVGNITVHRVGIGVPWFDKLYLAVFGYRYAVRLHHQQPFDFTWALMASYGGFAALSFYRATGVRYLLTLQEGDPIEYILRRVRLVASRFRAIFSSACGLQSISNYLHRWGYQMGFSGSSAEVIPNGVDVEAFCTTHPAEQVAATRRSFGFPSGAVVVVTASRLVLKNGVEHVIRALPSLPSNVCFYVCGVGELEPSLRQLTVDLGVDSRVRFAGFVSHADLPLVLQASDIFIRPSLTEGLGNSFLEAMAAGNITIGTMVGGIPDFLTDGVTGIACEPKNPVSVAQAINRAMSMDKAARVRMHNDALAMIRERFEWNSIAARMDVLISKMLR